MSLKYLEPRLLPGATIGCTLTVIFKDSESPEDQEMTGTLEDVGVVDNQTILVLRDDAGNKPCFRFADVDHYIVHQFEEERI